jgi:hypothetical protein
MNRYISLLLVLLTATASFAKDYFVANSGNDLNTGATALLALKTIGKANTMVAPGDRILLKNGDDFSAETWDTPQPNITYQTYGIGKPPSVGPVSILHNGTQFWYLDFHTATIVCSGASGVVVAYTFIRGIQDMGLIASSCTINMIGDVITGNAKTGIYAGSNTSIALKNCIVLGSGLGLDSEYFASLDSHYSGSTISYQNSIITGGGRTFDGWQITTSPGAYLDNGGNQFGVMPKTVMWNAPKAYFTFGIDDDFHDSAFWTSLDTVLAGLPSGHAHYTMFAVTANWTPALTAAASSIVSHGNEIGLHTWSHKYLDDLTGFTVSSTNASPQISIDANARTISLTSATAGNNCSLSWSAVPDATYNDLLNACSGKGWTLNTAPNNTVEANALRMKVMATQSSAISGTYTARVNEQAMFGEEIGDQITWANQTFGTTPKTVVYPHGNFSANLVMYLVNNSAFKAGPLTMGRTFTAFAHGYNNLRSLNMWELDGIYDEALVGDGSEGTIRQNARQMAAVYLATGGVLALVGHQDGQGGEMSSQQIGWFVDEVQQYCHCTFQTMASVANAIRADHTTTDGIVYTGTVPQVGDFRLQPGSPAIGAGANLGTAYLQALDPSQLGALAAQGTQWNIGGYVYGAISPGSGPAPPTGLQVIVK